MNLLKVTSLTRPSCNKFLKNEPRAVLNLLQSLTLIGQFMDRAHLSKRTLLGRSSCGSNKLLAIIFDQRSDFRFLHVSTDEVYGSLCKDEPAFTETHPYRPNSPYSAVRRRQIIWCVPIIKHTVCRC